MPHARINGIELYYEVHGTGAPLLLIAGLGFGVWSWFRQIPELSQQVRVIAFDNRGAGLSEKPDCEYTIEMMADDAAGLLRALNVTRAHVLGHSMGGYIAQELALRHPEVVSSLILASTSFGGKNAVLMSPETAAQMRSELEAEDREAALRRGLPLRFSDRFLTEHPEIVGDFLARRKAHLPPAYAWQRQFAACLRFETESHLKALRIPTLIVTGSDDPIVPSENSLRLARVIPNARLVIFPGARHLVFIERAEEFNRLVIEFLKGA
ncbi:MAG: alpha/beta hydrolase [Blastocatellia bacterium]|nr:alpha/beta hydrolase [Blastocatellia bacterium]MCS7157991.1 alpha/beta hydrolase [Blastocatellia bacterium]MCX7752498.1 alpha/beta hydrolase [Blastocatellia bacterium]MDW8167387.1 alpha/beta hydrolase [Acidobacteriota bacterium]MDW8257435.1 alpha/beta hydrolase [Acidobacteriota bacterium]